MLKGSFKDFIIESNILVEEGKFNADDISSAVDSVIPLIEKGLGQTVYKDPVPQWFNNELSGNGLGVLCYHGDGKAFRLNIIGNTIDNVSSISSVDVWGKDTDKLTNPDVNINLNGLNILQVIKSISNIIKDPSKIEDIVIEKLNPNADKVKGILDNDETIEESKYQFGIKTGSKAILLEEAKVSIGNKVYDDMYKAIEGLWNDGYQSDDIKEITGVSKDFVDKVLKDIGAVDIIYVSKGGADEILEPTIKLPKVPNTISVDALIEDIDSSVESVISGLEKSLILAGMKGVGKCIGAGTRIAFKQQDDSAN